MANVAVIRPVLRPRSWVLLLVVLVAVAGIAWLFGAARADTPVEAQFSSARDLVGLHWDAQGLRVAQVGPDGRARWSWLLPEAPDLDAIAQAPLSAAQPRAEVRYDGPHGEVHLDGHLILETDFEAVGAPVFAPNGQWFVVSRAPLGAETARLGELWRYDIPLERWTRLTYNNVEESSPAISPDGSQIAFLRDGTVWLRPAAADAPRRVPPAVPDPLPDMTAAAAAGALPQPATIRVLHVAENTCRPGVNVGDVTVVPFDEYVPGVLRQETIVSSWTDAALQANAVAERSYAWALTVVPKYPGQPYDIKDWVHDQAFCDCWWSGGRRNCRWEDPHYPRAVRLANETSGQYIAHEGQVVRAYYGAENSSPTTGIPGHPVFQAKDDPPGFGTKVSGHGWGMGQWNSERWGREGWSYIQILRHFYSNTTVEQAAGTDAPPLFDLDTPWNGRYLTGSGLPLTAQATSASQPVTHVQFRAGWPDGGWVIDDTTGENGWATILRLESIPDLPAQDVSQALRIAGTAVDAAGRETLEVGPSGAGILAGIDRQPPSLSATLIGREGDTARFSVTTSDAGPSGVQGVGWSRGWGWQESQLGATAGAAVDDSAAVDGRAWLFRHAQDGAPSTTTGPHFTALPAGELYRAWFRLRVSDTSSAAVVAVLDAVDTDGKRLLGIKRVRGTDFRRAGEYQEFFVDFDYRSYDDPPHPAPSGPLQFRVRWLGGADLALDRILVTTWPRPMGPELALPMRPDELVILKAADVAGNAGLDVPLTTAPPAPTHTPAPPPPTPQPAPIWLPLFRFAELRVIAEPPTPTAAPACRQLLVNGDMEGDGGWVQRPGTLPPLFTAEQAHAGARSLRLGPEDGAVPPGESWASTHQAVSIPAGATSAALELWIKPEGASGADRQYIILRDEADTPIRTLHAVTEDRDWYSVRYDLRDLAGQTIRLYFGVKNDGGDSLARLYVDDATLSVCP